MTLAERGKTNQEGEIMNIYDCHLHSAISFDSSEDMENYIKMAKNVIAKNLKVNEKEIYFTSCGSEADNLVIKGIAYANKEKGKHIITTNLEHSSIYGPIGYLQKLGYTVDFVKTNNGLVDIEDLKNVSGIGESKYNQMKDYIRVK